MATFIPDVKTQRWVIVSPKRNTRPDEKKSYEKRQAPVCPFCPGNEHLTPPEVYRIGEGEKDKTGWKVRVVPNKFPITDIHEVIIHSPSHNKAIHELESSEIANVFKAYRDRYRAHEAGGQVLIFCNQGFHAGASLAHPHSQLAVVPNQIKLDALSIEPFNNVIKDNGKFITYCPDFSQWPLETWIAPYERGKRFSDLTNEDIEALTSLFKEILIAIKKVIESPDAPIKPVNDPFIYNYYIYHGNDWFLRIIPRTIHRAGFELGTGLSVNVVDPKEAAERIKNILSSYTI